jgi:hypothetical protein
MQSFVDLNIGITSLDFPKMTATKITARITAVIARIRRLNAMGFNLYSFLFTSQLIPDNWQALQHLETITKMFK